MDEFQEFFNTNNNTDRYTQETLTYDPAGNMTYDGMFKFSYDAWNRLVGVKRAWRDYNGSPTNGIYPKRHLPLGRRLDSGYHKPAYRRQATTG